ncbi:protein jagged-1-like isoform X2 [Ruditapes philippinarum]|uniref:protein jagged-1-like isoform X2 n=1 Tax=Ruditapes philippinarum TaxID=129788 RepID=UPI00295A8B5F|nr:protein jagged-1-like isoform X2 [Ruditapes philippinarum]
MDSVKIMLAFVLLSYSMIVNGTPVDKCALFLCYLPINCDKSPPANGLCCPKCMQSQGQPCKYEVGEGSDKIKVNIPDGQSKKVDCNTCTCSDGVLACTKIGCVEP